MYNLCILQLLIFLFVFLCGFIVVVLEKPLQECQLTGSQRCEGQQQRACGSRVAG